MEDDFREFIPRLERDADGWVMTDTVLDLVVRGRTKTEVMLKYLEIAEPIVQELHEEVMRRFLSDVRFRLSCN